MLSAAGTAGGIPSSHQFSFFKKIDISPDADTIEA